MIKDLIKGLHIFKKSENIQNPIINIHTNNTLYKANY